MIECVCSERASGSPAISPASRKPNTACTPMALVAIPPKRPMQTTKDRGVAGEGSRLASIQTRLRVTRRRPNVQATTAHVTMPIMTTARCPRSTPSDPPCPPPTSPSTTASTAQPRSSFSAMAETRNNPRSDLTMRRSNRRRATTVMAVIEMPAPTSSANARRAGVELDPIVVHEPGDAGSDGQRDHDSGDGHHQGLLSHLPGRGHVDLQADHQEQQQDADVGRDPEHGPLQLVGREDRGEPAPAPGCPARFGPAGSPPGSRRPAAAA